MVDEEHVEVVDVGEVEEDISSNIATSIEIGGRNFNKEGRPGPFKQNLKVTLKKHITHYIEKENT